MLNARSITAAICAALTLTACGSPGERVRFDGSYYPSKLVRSGVRAEEFSVTVRRAAQGLNGAREAGRYEATRYCVGTYGNSDIAWQPGYGPEDGRAITDDGSLVLRGSCRVW